MRKLLTFCTVAIIILSAVNAHADMLLVQTYDSRWDEYEQENKIVNPSTVMYELGITYNQIPQSAFATQDLSSYKAILLQGSAQDTLLFNANIILNMIKVQAYVESGGLALIHYADLFFHGESPPIGL